MALASPQSNPPDHNSLPPGSSRRNRLRTFQDESPGENIDTVQVSPAKEPPASAEMIPSSSPTPPKTPPEQAKTPKQPQEDEAVTGTTSSSGLVPKGEARAVDEPNEVGVTAKTREAGGKSTKGKGRGKHEKSPEGGIVSTVWESMKRMMGFAPECRNGGYRSLGSAVCTCPRYFQGPLCEQIVCANGGSPALPVPAALGSAAPGEEAPMPSSCKCPHPDYIGGRHCEQVQCQNGGRLLSDGRCHCVDGWYSGQFCQLYTSSWLLAIGLPLLLIAAIIFCCVLCRMNLCALRRPTGSSRNRHCSADRRSHGRRRQQRAGQCSSPQHQQERRGRGGGGGNRHRREQVPFRQQQRGPAECGPTGMHQSLYIQQNLLNNGSQQPNMPQQYVLRLEQVPVYNPRLFVPVDKPLEPPPPYEQAIMCPPPSHEPPNYCTEAEQPADEAVRDGGGGEAGAGNATSRESSEGRENGRPSGGEEQSPTGR